VKVESTPPSGHIGIERLNCRRANAEPTEEVGRVDRSSRGTKPGDNQPYPQHKKQFPMLHNLRRNRRCIPTPEAKRRLSDTTVRTDLPRFPTRADSNAKANATLKTCLQPIPRRPGGCHFQSSRWPDWSRSLCENAHPNTRPALSIPEYACL